MGLLGQRGLCWSLPATWHGDRGGDMSSYFTFCATRCSVCSMSGRRNPKNPSPSAPCWYSPLAWYCGRQAGSCCCIWGAAAGTGPGAGGWGSPGSSHGRRACPAGTSLHRCRGRSLSACTARTLQRGRGHCYPENSITPAHGRGSSPLGMLCIHLRPRRRVASFLEGTAPARAFPVPCAVLQGGGWEDWPGAH